MILVAGDSFTFGEELDDPDQDAWPQLIDRYTENIAEPGYSNDAIVKSIVRFVENDVRNEISGVIVAWTTPHRIEVNGKHLTPTSHRRYGSICDQVFLDWDEEWAVEKFYTQVLLLDSYLARYKIPAVFVRTFDVPDCSVGNWVPGSMVEWMGDCPKGPGGHPLEQGHEQIAEHINEYIRNLGWVS
jgi:ribosomal protein S17E